MNDVLHKLSRSWPFWLGLVVGFCGISLQITGFDLSFVPGDYGDGRFNNYILEHGHRWMTGQEPSFWNAPFMYPEPDVITYSDNLIGTMPLYSLWRGLGFDMETAFQLWYLLLTALNYIACYAFLKWLFRNRYAAATGAFVFAFSLALQSQLTHAQTYPRLFIPLAIWMLLKYRKELDPRFLFVGLLFLVAQFYSGIYLGFMLTVPFGLLFLIIVISQRKLLAEKIQQLRWWLLSLAAIAINAYLLLALMYPYYLRSQTVGENPFSNILGTIPTVRSFFFSQPGSLLWDRFSSVANDYPAAWDHQIFPGILSLLSIGFLVFALFFRRRKTELSGHGKLVWLLAISGVITFILFLRYNAYSLYILLYHLPGFSSMRSLTRIVNVELIFFAIAIALAVFLIVRKYQRYGAIAFCIILGLLLVDNYTHSGAAYTTGKADLQQRVDALSEMMKDIPRGSVVSYEPNDNSVPAFFHQLDAMLATQRLGLKAINAYTATSPGSYSNYWWNLNEQSRNEWLNAVGAKPDTVYVISTSIGITPVN